MTPHQWLAKLAALVPPPKVHLVRYGGVFVFATDVTTCPCGGRLRPLGAVLTPDDIAAHLHGARASPRPVPHGQLSLLP